MAVHSQNCHTGNHMPYGITVLPPSGSGDFPAFTPLKLVLDLATLEAELTWVLAISQDSLPTKYGHLSQNNHAALWLGIEPTTQSHKTSVLTTRLPSIVYVYYFGQRITND